MEKIIKSIPVISGLLIFLGFLNYTFYYNFFGLEISSFLTTGELFLSFLRLTIPLLFICATLTIYLLLGITNIIIFPEKENNAESEENEIEAIFINEHFKIFIKEIRSRKFKMFTDYLHSLLSLISLIGIFLHQILLLGFPIFVYNEINSSEPYFLSIELTLGIGVYWFLLVFGFLNKLEKRRNINYRGMIIAFAIIFSISCIYIANKDKATSVLRGHSNYSVKLYFSKDTISTDSNVIYIGKTDRYIFFRNLRDSSNDIYKMNNILRLEMKE